VFSTPPLRGSMIPHYFVHTPLMMHLRWTPIGGVLTPPSPAVRWDGCSTPPQREFILSVFHRQKKDYRPNHQTLFLILTGLFGCFFGEKWVVWLFTELLWQVFEVLLFFVSSAPEAILCQKLYCVIKISDTKFSVT